jgi:hypothetical protein
MLSTILAEHQKELWSVVTIVLSVIANRVSRLRPKLRYSFGHAARLVIKEPLIGADGSTILEKQLLQTRSLTVANWGLQPAKAVEVTYNFKPRALSVWEPRAYTEVSSADDRYTIRFESLAPGESVLLEILALNMEPPLVTAVRSDDCVGKPVSMTLQRTFPGWLNVILAVIMLLGAVTAIYLLISLLQAVVRL